MLQLSLIVYGLGAVIAFGVAGLIKLISHIVQTR